MLSKLWAAIKTSLSQKKYEDQTKKTFVVLNSMDPNSFPKDPSAWNIKHILHDERLAQYKKELLATKAAARDTVSFGDSLMDGWTKDTYTAVKKDRNFNIAGSWANHMRDMYKEIIPFMMENKIYVNNIIIGCLGGNPLLAMQPIDITIQKSVEVLKDLRAMIPNPKVRIIVYGIPPTVDIYVNKNAMAFEAALYQWVLSDMNAVFLPLQKKFAGFLGMFPKFNMTADGVHFSENGVYEFDQLLIRAKSGMMARIVD
jgi:hypothetical protein